MQRITIEVKDSYTENVLEMLHSIKGIMIEKIRYDDTSFLRSRRVPPRNSLRKFTLELK
jgi:hypothetical protein